MLTIQDQLQYREIVDLDIFEKGKWLCCGRHYQLTIGLDIDLWFAKATLMYAIANAMISDEIDPSTDRTAMDVEVSRNDTSM